MHDLTWLSDLLTLFALAIAVGVVCHRLRIPTMIGFLLTGVVAGPSGLGLVTEMKSVEILAEIGVVLLLFSIGIEFSLDNLFRIRSTILLGGGLQVLLTGVAVFLLGHGLLGLPLTVAVFLGMLVALSSTAIVLKLYSGSGEVDSPQGRIVLGILIFQDLCIVPMMIVVPLLAGNESSVAAMASVLGEAVLLVVVVLLLGRYVVPWVLQAVVATRSRETFLLTVVLLCLGTAWLGTLVGLSLALGAFLAGLVVSQSEYCHQALGEIIPFRDVFSSLFLISIGMLLHVDSLGDPEIVFLHVGTIIVLKAVIASGVALILGYSFRVAWIAGLSLAQVGEFSFVLARVGLRQDLLPLDLYQYFLASAIVTMALTPLLKSVAPLLADRLVGILPRSLGSRRGRKSVPTDLRKLEGHVIIVGYGINGRSLAKVLRQVHVPYVVVELNPRTVRVERRLGGPIVYGDAASPDILEYAGISHARVLVVAVADAPSIRRITAQARRLQPGLHIIVRTRYLQEMEPLRGLGANEVVPEEFETALEIVSRTLRHLLVPRDVVERFVREARVDGYGLLRARGGDRPELEEGEALLGASAGMEVFRVEAGSPIEGRTLEGSGLRQDTGANVLALQMENDIVCNPPSTTRLVAGMVAVVFGTPEQLSAAARRFRPQEPASDSPASQAE